MHSTSTAKTSSMRNIGSAALFDRLTAMTAAQQKAILKLTTQALAARKSQTRLKSSESWATQFGTE